MICIKLAYLAWQISSKFVFHNRGHMKLFLKEHEIIHKIFLMNFFISFSLYTQNFWVVQNYRTFPRKMLDFCSWQLSHNSLRGFQTVFFLVTTLKLRFWKYSKNQLWAHLKNDTNYIFLRTKFLEPKFCNLQCMQALFIIAREDSKKLHIDTYLEE